MHRTDEPTEAGTKSLILRSLVKLPPMPHVILRAREVMADPNAGLRDMAKVIENDQALVARVLALANSAYYGISGQVSSVQHAAALLGLKTLMDLIIMSASSLLLERKLKAYQLSPRAIWAHSLASALCAREIAAKRFPGTEADAFVVGLLHDAGKIILDPFLDKARKTSPTAWPQSEPLTALREREILGFDHAEIMARACRFWRFPESQVRGIRFHHQPSQSSQSALAYAAHLANFLAHQAGFGDDTACQLEEGALAFAGLQAADGEELKAAMMRGFERLDGQVLKA